MFPTVALTDVVLDKLRRWAWLIALLALLGFGFMFYRWAYERGVAATQAKHVEDMIDISNEAYDLVTGFQADVSDLRDQLADARSATRAARATIRAERTAHYAKNPQDSLLCLTPARVGVLESNLAALAGTAPGARGGKDAVPAGVDASRQDSQRGPAF